MNISRSKTPRDLSLEAFADRVLQLSPGIMQHQVRQERNYLARGLISLPQLWALRQIAGMGTCAMRTLAQAQGLQCSTLTGLIDRLVELGLVKRFQSATDRRAVLVTITPKGRKILTALRAERRKSIMLLFRSISQRERTIYLEILEKVARALAPPAQPQDADSAPAERDG